MNSINKLVYLINEEIVNQIERNRTYSNLKPKNIKNIPKSVND